MIQLNYRDSRPIYEQIKDGLQRLIISQAIAADEKLPSVRELAASMAINPNTIQRAYRELEAEGYIYTVSGKGSFASDKVDIGNTRTNVLLKEFDKIVSELLFLSYETVKLTERVNFLAGGKET